MALDDYNVTSQTENYAPTGEWTDVPGTTLRTEDLAAAFYRVTIEGDACDFRVVQAQFVRDGDSRVLGPYEVSELFEAANLSVGTHNVFATTYGHRVKIQARSAGGSPEIFVRGRGIEASVSAGTIEALQELMDPREDTVTIAKLAELLPILDDGASVDGSELADVETAIASATASAAAVGAVVEDLEPSVTADADLAGAITPLETFAAAFAHETNGLRAIITAREDNGGGSGWPAYVGTIATDTVDDLLAYIATV